MLTRRSQPSILSKLWNLVLAGMLLWFLASLVNSSVHGHLHRLDEQAEEALLAGRAGAGSHKKRQ